MINDSFISYLETLRGRRVYYWPNPGNAGDAFIATAIYWLFSKYSIAFDIIDDEKQMEGKTILFAGGGNLVEGKYDHMANAIRKYLPDNKCVVLPHTVFGYRDILSHPSNNLHLFVRDPISFQICKLNGIPEENINLAHDAVFYLPREYFSDWQEEGKGRAVCLRQDGESTKSVYVPPNNIDISMSWNGALWHNVNLAKDVTRSLASYLSPYREVETDRLHVAILATFLNKQVIFYPNNYYKNRAIFEHSIAGRFSNVGFVNTSTDLLHSEYVTSLLKEKGIS
ncbi:polysaccharide pyruvyl transferase family protein [Brucella pituitosa]|uniref:polysaccharide pyruvyl transferase family protein n=1 Tax=Brucella pituitosa TaxID=571256 RepID=UPI002005442A|nr:polysaccharide pyruvyl transferase family protein [Brucella pituitosa]MCK4205240.1 polysaccharide pyruvyl transferase family protein [Brucella pituitosa]